MSGYVFNTYFCKALLNHCTYDNGAIYIWYNNMKIIIVSVRAVPELIVGKAGRQSNFSTKPHARCAHQWPDNVKMYK